MLSCSSIKDTKMSLDTWIENRKYNLLQKLVPPSFDAVARYNYGDLQGTGVYLQMTDCGDAFEELFLLCKKQRKEQQDDQRLLEEQPKHLGFFADKLVQVENLVKEEELEESIDELFSLASYFHDNKEDWLGAEVLEISTKIAKLIPRTDKIAEIYFLNALTHLAEGNSEKARIAFTRVLDYTAFYHELEEKQSKERLRLGRLACNYLAQLEMAEAKKQLPDFNKCLALLETAWDYIVRGTSPKIHTDISLEIAGIINNKEGRKLPYLCKEYIMDALETAKFHGLDGVVAHALLMLAKIAISEMRIESSRALLQNALEVARKASEKDLLAEICLEIGKISKDKSVALQYFLATLSWTTQKGSNITTTNLIRAHCGTAEASVRSKEFLTMVYESKRNRSALRNLVLWKSGSLKSY